ncbi:DUF4254 domain-containing protein [Nocardia asteroides]|uniref:DUF4254 domain-containing protein n=1 Tax=Nocardia asteroides TaxID=1824 RepID=UPI001E60FDE5|nr:DUF4254 domain-containing protein [Nocardia asteroides]UGT64323.1 DUF4254 domain-containing protein [Nocardia asteroides]
MRDAELPDRRELLTAFASPAEAGDDPVIRSAALLAELHRQRHIDPLAAAGIDCRRAELVAAVDRWTSAARPARVRGVSLGALLDRMAAAHVHAGHLLHSCDKVAETRVHAAWYRLATLADEWSDLVAGYLPERSTASSR